MTFDQDDSAMVTHLDLWLDDISMDFVGRSASAVAQNSIKTFRLLKGELLQRKLPINVGKTKIVASNQEVAKQLRQRLEPGDPMHSLT